MENDEEKQRRLVRYNKILLAKFGYESLKSEQYEVIRSILENNDTIAVFATGAGKSLNYQMIHLITKKCVIVICPLISLIADQHRELCERNIKSVIFNGTIERSVIQEEKRKILETNDNNCIIFMTPEYCNKSETFIKQMHELKKLRMVCIDECHCVSGWADFRASYAELGNIKKWVPDVDILGLSATMTKKILDDVIDTLRLHKPKIIKGDFNRPNLYYCAKRKTNNSFSEIMGFLTSCISNGNFAILYCLSKKDTAALSEEITNAGIVCKAYHAGFTDEYRSRVQEEFMRGEFKVICATISFGLGINIPNVEYVIHYNCPKSMESYMQEMGRAGRNQTLEAKCYMYYNAKDFSNLKYFLSNVHDPVLKNYQESQIDDMEKYCYSRECRRKLLLKAFNQDIDNCGKCDNCLNPQVTVEQNYYVETYYMLNLIDKYDGKFGGSTIIDVLIGKSKIKGELRNLAEFGIGSTKTEVYWKHLLQILKLNSYIESKKKSGNSWITTIKMTRLAKNWLSDQKNKYNNCRHLLETYSGDNLIFETIQINDEPVKKKVTNKKKDMNTRIKL